MNKFVKYLIFFLLFIFVLIIVVFFNASFGYSSKLFGEVISEIETEEKIVFLTFDGGPSFNSEKLLDILVEKNVKATHFVVGQNVEGNEEILKKFRDEGHDFGTHSMTHAFLSDNIYEEVFKSKLVIEEAIEENITLFRPPYGFRTPETIRQARKYGLYTVMWSSFPKDYKRGKDKVLNTVLKDLRPGIIIVIHDHAKMNLTSLEVLPELIDEIRERNYSFGLINDYIEK